MANIHKFEENVRVTYGGVTVAIGGISGDALVTPTFVNMKNYDLVVIQAVVTHASSDKVITLKAYEATATNGAASQSLTHALASDTFTSTNVTDTDKLVVQVRGEDLSAGFQYVGAFLSTNQTDGTEYAGMVINQMRARYKQATMPA
jgi:uncharacterized protein YjlB